MFDSETPLEFFDVSIAPVLVPRLATIKPLVVEAKQIGYEIVGLYRVVFYLTLRNDSEFAVNFQANHVRIYAS